MKSQSISMKTIIYIVIGLIALAVIVMFFFTGFNYGRNSTSILTNTSNDQINSARCDSAILGSCPTGQYCNPLNGECVYSCPFNYYTCDDNMKCVNNCDSECNGKTASGGACV